LYRTGFVWSDAYGLPFLLQFRFPFELLGANDIEHGLKHTENNHDLGQYGPDLSSGVLVGTPPDGYGNEQGVDYGNEPEDEHRPDGSCSSQTPTEEENYTVEQEGSQNSKNPIRFDQGDFAPPQLPQEIHHSLHIKTDYFVGELAQKNRHDNGGSNICFPDSPTGE
tara:strand:- start:8561 stop:9058 length:498 start_codon:yes stop_codon:yes gene_type:complete